MLEKPSIPGVTGTKVEETISRATSYSVLNLTEQFSGLSHADVVRRVLLKHAKNLPPGTSIDEFEALAWTAYHQFSLKVTKGKGRADVSGLLYTYISRAIIDEMRKISPIAAWTSRNIRRIRSAASQLESELGRSATIEEAAKAAGMPLEVAKHAIEADTAMHTSSLDDHAFHIEDNSPPTETQVEVHDLRSLVNRALGQLPRQEERVLIELYLDQTPAREVAETLGVSQARVYQLRDSGLAKLRRLPFVRELSGTSVEE